MTLKKRACASVRTHVGSRELEAGGGGLPDDAPPLLLPPREPLHLGWVSADTCLS